MAQVFGALGIADSELVFTDVEGQRVIWDETQRIFEMWNQDMEAALSLFVEEDTDSFKERYYLPGGGEGQDEDPSAAAETAAVRPSGQWDVAYPIHQVGDSVAWDDIGIRFVTMGRYDATIQTVMNRANNSTFRRVLRGLLKNTNTTFKDPERGDLTLVPLANQDGTLYPPVYGSTAEAQQNLYIGTSYLPAAISNANNPFKLLRSKLEPLYGFPQGGSPIVALVATDVVEPASNLAGFDEQTNRYVIPGANITTIGNTPDMPGGMRIVGVDAVAGVVIVEWPRLPSGIIIGLHMDARKPLKKRVDRPALQIPRGLHLWSQTVGEPYTTARWRLRQGFAVGNRIGAVVINLTGTGTYAIPSGYE